MPRQLCSPGALDLHTPGRRDYHVTFEHPSLWGQFLVPVTVMIGPEARDGRGLLAIGGTHGNEYEGPVAIKHLLREIRQEDVRGRIILIPTLSVMSFRAGQRDAPEDGVNMNRAFPGSATGTISAKIADLVHRILFPQVHVVLDIHSGGRVARFPLVSSFHEVADEAQHLAMEVAARDFGAPVTMIYQNQTAGLLTSTAERLGKITIGTEMGWGQAVNADGVALTRRGILAAAIRQGLLHGTLPNSPGTPAAQQLLVDVSHPACAFLAPYDGHFEPVRHCGETVRTGELVAWLHDFDRLDDAPLAIQAPHDGVIVCLAWEARVFQGQVLSLVGPVRPWRGKYEG